MNTNYPIGSENDPKAPWNKKDPVMEECEECNGTGIIEDEEGGTDITCDECDGDGKIERIDDEQ